MNEQRKSEKKEDNLIKGKKTVDKSTQKKVPTNTQACPDCTQQGHDENAKYCKYCGAELNPE